MNKVNEAIEHWGYILPFTSFTRKASSFRAVMDSVDAVGVQDFWF